MTHEELNLLCDRKLLRAMYASVNDVHYTVRRSAELIEQSRIALRELVVLGVDCQRTS